MENVLIPKTGTVSEISFAVAKVLNESIGQDGAPVLKRQIDSLKLQVANIYMNRLNKLFSSDEAYNLHFEDIVVYEDDDCPVSTAGEIACQTRSLALKPNGYVLPVFIREANENSGEISISRPFFVNIKHLTYEDIREAIFQELLSLVSSDETENFLQAIKEEIVKEEKPNIISSKQAQPSKRQNVSRLSEGSDGEATSEVEEEEEPSSNQQPGNSMGEDGDEDEGVEASGSSYYNTRSRSAVPNPPFSISVVNMYATSEFSVLRPGVRLDTALNTFLSVNLSTKIVSKFFPRELNTHRQIKLSTMLPSSNRTLTPKTSITLGECINQFTLTEKLGSDDPWYCPRCKKHQMASKKFDVFSLPEILIIHLKRFSYSRLHRDKLDVLVEFPVSDLDMTPYVQHNPSDETYLYNLIGVANHFGGLGGGHYTAYAKNCLNNLWYYFDDSSVTPVQTSSIVTKSAYVLFYQRQQANASDSQSTGAPEVAPSTETNGEPEEINVG